MSQSDSRKRAAALKYSPDLSQSAPIVVAAGMGFAAQKIIDLARDSSVPVYEDASLAALLSQLDAGEEIPPELYRAIVDIYVYFLNYDPRPPAAGARDKSEEERKIFT